jgi:hypothetical protein
MHYLANLRVAMILLPALIVGGCSAHLSPPLPAAQPGRPAISIPLTDYPPQTQAQVAREVREAPPGAAWPRLIGDYSTTRRAVCAVTPAQAACRRICAAEGNAPAFCARIDMQ